MTPITHVDLEAFLERERLLRSREEDLTLSRQAGRHFAAERDRWMQHARELHDLIGRLIEAHAYGDEEGFEELVRKAREAIEKGGPS